MKSLITIIGVCLASQFSFAADIPLGPNFPSLKANIFDAKCVRCHSSPDGAAKISLTTYEEILNTVTFPPLIVPGNPEASTIFKVVSNGSMPKRAAALSQEELAALYAWIKMGAKKSEDSNPGGSGDQAGNPNCGQNEPGCGSPN